jgi:hypothetical protein
LLKLIEAEMRVAMALTGHTAIAAIDRTVLADWMSKGYQRIDSESRRHSRLIGSIW